MTTPTPTVINGAPLQLGSSVAVIDGTSYTFGLGAPKQTVVINQQTISIGPGGIGFADTTVVPPSDPTAVAILGASAISAVGASIAVIGDSTFTYGPGSSPQTDIFNGQTIIIGPGGIALAATTLGGASNPSATQIGIAGGLTVSEIGSTLAVISGTTFTIGPGATTTAAVINGKTISVGPSGIGLASTTLAYPLNPTTQAITAEGVNFLEVGSTIAVIGGTTFTFGPGAKTTTDVYNGQTISIGPGGIGFATTTIVPSTAAPASTHNKNPKNGVGALRPMCGILGIYMVLGVGILI
jgi:hypothetical protein